MLNPFAMPATVSRLSALMGTGIPMPERSILIERLDTTESIIQAADQLAATAAPTGFQTPAWLAAVYRHLVPAGKGMPLCLTVRSQTTGGLDALLPFYVRDEGGLRIARFADCGVTDYNAALGGDWAQSDPDALIAALKPALAGVDVLELRRLPHDSTLGRHSRATPSRYTSNRVTMPDGVNAYVRARGKKFRKEVERSFRVLASEGVWAFERAATPAKIETAFAALERQQGERHADKGCGYALGAPQFGAFYREVLADPSGFAAIFTLSVNGTIIAVLMGIEHRDTFTLLRISNGGEAWKHVSPGRLIVVETLHYYVGRGIRAFDMGIGNYAFKRSFGAQQSPLIDLVVPVSWRGWPYAAKFQLMARLRQYERLRGLIQRWRIGRV